jgi:hypothetical protein
MEVMRHPAVLLLLVWLGTACLQRLAWPDARAVNRVLTLFGAACILIFSAIVVWYALQTAYFDAAEPTIPSVAAVFAAGHPLYPALDAPERYAHVYGPMLFVVQALALAIVGPSILASKVVGAVAVLGSLALAYRVYLPMAGRAGAVFATALCGLVYLYFGNVTFWTRSDPLLILCAVGGLAAARARRPGVASVGLAIALGLSANLKATGPLYLAPAVVLAHQAHGVRASIGAVVGSAILAAAPFALSNVSLWNYVDYLRLSARNGVLGIRLRENVEWMIFLGAPLAAAMVAARRGSEQVQTGFRRGSDVAQTSLLVALGVCGAIVAIVSAKPGGGAFHLLPLMPAAAFAAVCLPVDAWRMPLARAGLFAFALTALAIAVPRQYVFLTTVAGRDLGQAVEDIERFADAHPGRRIAVGYAGTSYASHARPELVSRTRDYLIDAPAVQEHRLSGLEMPASLLQALDDCRVELWLIPKDGVPFDVPSAYSPLGPREVFPESFRAAFARRHSRVGSTPVFDVWECQRAAARGTD